MKSLESMTVAELRDVQREVADLIARRAEEEKGHVLAKLRAMASDAGFTLEELVRGQSSRLATPKPAAKSGDKRGTVAPKYQDPASAATWTGRGKKPKWVEAALAAGKTLDGLLITK